jgi:hypothetical protein
MAKRRKVGWQPRGLTSREDEMLAAGKCPDCGLPLDLPDRGCAECTHNLRRHIPVAMEPGREESIRFQCGECRKFCPVPADLHAAMNPEGLLSRTPSDSRSEVEFMMELATLGAELVELGELMETSETITAEFPWARLKRASERVMAVEDTFRPVIQEKLLDIGLLLRDRIAIWEWAPEDHLPDIRERGEELAGWGYHMMGAAREMLPHLSSWGPRNASARTT